MKVLFPILAIYMMVVFLMPCADVFETKSFQNYNHSEVLVHQESHEHSETNDFCSPFCLCNCCGVVSGIVFQWDIYNFGEVKSFDFYKPEVYYKSIFIPHYFGEIWQPPKINI